MASPAPLGPALPWANVPANNPSNPATNEERDTDMVACTLEEMDMDIGARIEVRWEIVNDDQLTTLKWWGATVDFVPSDPPPPEAERRKAQAYLLRYDAFEDFEAEERKVMFITKKQLFDLESDAPLKWRKSGDDYDGESDSEDEEEAMEEEGEEERGSFTLNQFIKAGEILEPEKDASVLNVPMPNITPHQERLVAEHLNSFIGGFLAHIQSTKNPGAVVTADDVKEYFKDKKPPSA